VSSISFQDILTAEQAADLTARGRARRFRRGATLFNEGDSSDHIALVTRGRVKVSYLTERGDEILLAVRGPGDLLGELSALDGQPRSATVTALEPVEAHVVGAVGFKAFLEAHPVVALRLLEMMARRLRDSDRVRVEFGAFDTLGRVARRLVELASAYGEPSKTGIRIALPLTQQELAGWIGSSREAVSKALRTLRNQGIVATRRGSIVVLDLDALRRRAV
jgi:CRP/FNR family cyclic AMP-dependent transcriptional regulator